MILAFELGMPSNNSWNGRWSGEGRRYVITKTFRGKPPEPNRKKLDGESFYYRFGDGWMASVAVREVDAAEARRLRKASKGFCGYDWMVDSILRHGEIRSSS